MRLRAKVFAMAAAVFGVVLISPPAQADSTRLEKQIEKLTQAVVQLQEVVKKQDKEINRQNKLIDQLGIDMCSAETAQALAPHIDKHLTHSEAGIGEQLGNLHLGVGLTGIVQGSLEADDIDPDGANHTDGNWSLDIEIEAHIGENGLGFVAIEVGQGDNLNDELSVFHAVNGDATGGDSGLEIIEAWYEHYFRDEMITLTVGKIDPSNYVDGNAVANDETAQFLNGGLVNSLAIEFPDDNGAGVHVAITPNDFIELNVAWAEADADWEDVFNDSFGIAEINIMPGFLGRDGNYRFYAWYNGSDKTKLDGSGDNDEDGWGVGVSLDQQLTDNITAFARLAVQDDEVYEVETAWSLGAEIKGTKWNRENDAFGIAIAQAILSDNITPDDSETLIEIYYSYAVNDQLFITPDIQIIDSPGGDDDNDTLFVFGVRGQVNF